MHAFCVFFFPNALVCKINIRIILCVSCQLYVPFLQDGHSFCICRISCKLCFVWQILKKSCNLAANWIGGLPSNTGVSRSQVLGRLLLVAPNIARQYSPTHLVPLPLDGCPLAPAEKLLFNHDTAKMYFLLQLLSAIAADLYIKCEQDHNWLHFVFKLVRFENL